MREGWIRIYDENWVFFLVAKNVGGQSQLIKDPVWPETVNNVSAPALM